MLCFWYVEWDGVPQHRPWDPQAAHGPQTSQAPGSRPSPLERTCGAAARTSPEPRGPPRLARSLLFGKYVGRTFFDGHTLFSKQRLAGRYNVFRYVPLVWYTKIVFSKLNT